MNATREIGLRSFLGSSLRLSVYTDDAADYAAASNDRRPVPVVAVLVGDTVIGWKSSTQEYVTTPTAKQRVFPCAMRLRRRYSQRVVLEFLQLQLRGMRVDIFGDYEGSKVI